jgi:hypothetical protein
MNDTQSPDWAQWTGDQQFQNHDGSCLPLSFDRNMVQTDNPIYSCTAMEGLGEASRAPFLPEVSHMQ